MTLSVIVPAYNVENYIGPCLNSIPDPEASGRLRIIIVNDESTDQTGEICRAFTKEHPEAVCIDQPHAGLGAARNTGLEAADTDYVTFLDGDDWYQEHFCSMVLDRLEQNDFDILCTLPVIFNMREQTENDWYDKKAMLGLEAQNPDGTDVQSEPGLLGLQTSCCNRVYKTAFLRADGFRFPEGVHWEDVVPHFHLMHAANKVGFLTDTGFVYRQGRPGQITESKDSRNTDLAVVFSCIMEEAFCWPDRELRYVYSRLFNMTRWRCRDAAPAARAVFLRKIKEMYDSFPKDQVRRFLSDKEITPSLSHRMMNRLIRKGSRLTLTVYGIRDRLRSK